MSVSFTKLLWVIFNYYERVNVDEARGLRVSELSSEGCE